MVDALKIHPSGIAHQHAKEIVDFTVLKAFIDPDTITASLKPRISFLQRDSDKTIIRAVISSIDFINKSYGNKFRHLLPIQILDAIPQTSGGLVEPGAVYNQAANEVSPNGVIQLDTSFLKQSSIFKTNKFAQHLKSNLGLSAFTKLVTFHEVGHHMDYMMRHEMLEGIPSQGEKSVAIDQKDSIGEGAYQDFFRYWTSTDEVNAHIKRNFKENMADCWSCVFLKQENFKVSLSEAVRHLKDARKISHEGKPDSCYSTYNALDRLLVNIKLMPRSSPNDLALLVQASAQQGLILNFKELMNNSRHQDWHGKLSDSIDPNIRDIVNKTVKRLKI